MNPATAAGREEAGRTIAARILAVRNSPDFTATRENTILLRIAGHPPGLRVLGPRTDGAAVAWVQDLCEDDPQDDEGFGRRA